MGKFLVISAHDFRSPRKANIHFIAEELSRMGDVRFFSCGFSFLSKIKGRDPRLGMEKRANKVERFRGVECYLWHSVAHPGNMGFADNSVAIKLWYEGYANSAPNVFWEWVREAETIIIESGFGVIFLDLIRRHNSNCKIIYRASDSLQSIGTSSPVLRMLEKFEDVIDLVVVPSRAMRSDFRRKDRIVYVPHGIGDDLELISGESPFTEGVNAVSVGSMLFDDKFFQIAGEAFPSISFFVIGAGRRTAHFPENVKLLDEMPFVKTLPYLKFADFGIAAYKSQSIPRYLADTSMKMTQYDFLKIPSVCPIEVVGEGKDLRHGYVVDDPVSITNAINSALVDPRVSAAKFLRWRDVVDRMLAPDDFKDTSIDLI